ncbi:MAG: coproporphyrinogen-III oxidase family protein, partial [Candidatus Kapaibacteriota bacterium]
MAGIYIHIPFCEKKCIYCDFYSITNKSLIDYFITSLLKEITLFADAINKADKKSVETIYFGGGTPSILSPKAFEKIFETLYQKFNINEQCEITIECNPGTDFTSKLSEFKSLGINRISIGVQSLHPEELKFLTRIHTRNQAIEAIERTLSFFENVNVDIIFSLPYQT